MTGPEQDAPVRLVTEAQLDEAWALGLQAFGGDPQARRRPAPERQQWGVFAGGRLVATATGLRFTQWWGGAPVPLTGLAGVAVAPHARGRGHVRALVRAIADATDAPLAGLYGTAPGVYRSLGFEVVAAWEETRMASSILGTAAAVCVDGERAVRLRPAGPEDAPALQQLWNRHAARTQGELTRVGPHHPGGAQMGVLQAEIVTLALHDDVPVGYVAYDRGQGYGSQAELLVHELVTQDAQARVALLHSLAGWRTVTGNVRFRGATGDLGVLLSEQVPAPHERRPYSLRVLDPVAAVAARGWAAELDLAFDLVDPERGDRAYRLVVQAGAGRLEATLGRGLPRLHVRGLAMLYAGAADTGALRRLGLLDGALPGLDAALAGPRPALHDYF